MKPNIVPASTRSRRYAWLHLGACSIGAAFLLCLAAGAPWGAVTMAGAYPGVLPPEMRVASALQAVLLLSSAAVILACAGVLRRAMPAWAGWAVVAYDGVALALNLATPVALERLLWGPVTAVMLFTSVAVLRGRAGSARADR